MGYPTGHFKQTNEVGISHPKVYVWVFFFWNPNENTHEVRNLDHIHGVSMNYVDLSNVELSILESVWDNEALRA